MKSIIQEDKPLDVIGITTLENLLESILNIDIKDEKDAERDQDYTHSAYEDNINDISHVTDNLMKSVYMPDTAHGEIENMVSHMSQKDKMILIPKFKDMYNKRVRKSIL